jgi:DNA (cytosine-5)-methyltransferase 1
MLEQNHKPYSYAEIFAAPGGLSLGFKMAEFRVLAGVDIDRDGLKTFRANFPSAAVLCKDVRTLDGKELLGLMELSKAEIDVIGGGPPCQGFSTVGRVKIASLVRKGLWKLQNGNARLINDPRNLLYKEFIRLVKECRPKFFVMENVKGITSYRNGELMKEIKREFEIIEELETAGYTVNYRPLDAVNFGVPQHRNRVFFIGNRLGLPNPFPEAKADCYMEKNVSVWNAIGDLPMLRAGGGKEIMDYNKPTFHFYQNWARDGSSHVFNHVARPHKPRDLETFKQMRPGDKWKDLPQKYKDMYGYRDDIFNDKFKRLRKKEGPSWTITAHLCKDGYVYIHPTQSRTITVREAARLQSFPDSFVFKGSRSSQFRQVGNAVSPLLARAVAQGIKSALDEFHQISAPENQLTQQTT